MDEAAADRVEFAPMDAATFATWREGSIRGYAEERVRSGQWAVEGALERARSDGEKLLTKGAATPGHYIRSVVALTGTKPVVGSLWWAERDHPGGRTGYIFDVGIDEAFRRQGYARAALELLSRRCREQGLRSLGLHVFAYKTGALALYEGIGFETTSHNMTLSFV
jgi:ribosomal protein S18 acetylase RimI-like enzyme